MIYLTKNELVKKIKPSESTVDRFYRTNKEIKENETRLEKIKGKLTRLYPESHLVYFDKKLWLKEFEAQKVKIKSKDDYEQRIKNTIDYYRKKPNSIGATMWYADWTHFVTIAYKYDKSKEMCRREMTGVYDELVNRFGKKVDVAMFFTTEPFNNRKGYHNHFVFDCPNDELYAEVEKCIKDYFSSDRVDVAPYDHYRGGTFYIAKAENRELTWDIFGTNLPKTFQAF